MLYSWVWLFCPIWSNISLSACEYKVEERGNYLKNMSPGIVETIAGSERGSVYNRSARYPFSPSVATRLFCPARVGKSPPHICKWPSPLKTQTSVFSAVHPQSSPCLKLLNPVSKRTVGRERGGSPYPHGKKPDLKNSQGDNWALSNTTAVILYCLLQILSPHCSNCHSDRAGNTCCN